jgi:hypothetical protein
MDNSLVCSFPLSSVHVQVRIDVGRDATIDLTGACVRLLSQRPFLPRSYLSNAHPFFLTPHTLHTYVYTQAPRRPSR